MKKYIILGTILLLVGAGCTNQTVIKNDNKNSVGSTKIDTLNLSTLEPTAVVPSSTQALETETDEQHYLSERQKDTDIAVERYRKNNVVLQRALFKDYSGLPELIETSSTIQVYAKLFVSSSGNSELYSLRTLSKSAHDGDDFSGDLGAARHAIFYVCEKNLKTCTPSTMIERAIAKGVPGYIIDFQYCMLGWDAEKQKIYSTNCGEGGSWNMFGQFDYAHDQAFVWGKDGDVSHYLGLNKQLTRFALERTGSKSSALRIDIYSLDKPTKPALSIDLATLAGAPQPQPATTLDPASLIVYDQQGAVSSFVWEENGESATFDYQNNHYVLDVKSGNAKQILN